MATESERTVLPLKPVSNPISDDHYLAEMTERLQKLRSLMGEQAARNSGAKRWTKRVSLTAGF